MGAGGKTGLLLALLVAVAWGASQYLGWQPKLPEGVEPAPKAAGPLRKCLPESGAGAVLYSSSACPAGTREQAMAGGTVNVIPSAAAVAQAKPASAQPLMHRLAPPEEAAALREKRMEKIVGP